MSEADDRAVTLNGVTYRWPRCPVVVVCIDGGDPAYFEQAGRDGIIPTSSDSWRRGSAPWPTASCRA